MTAIPSFAFPDVDASHLDDKMDVASSPFRQADDIDIDLDSVRDPSVIGSVHDEMFDDPIMPADEDLDVMQDHFEDALADDDMIDDTTQDASAQQDPDYNMEGSGPVLGDEDEDILYEDEEETKPLPAQNEGTVEYNDDQAPQDYQEVAAEVILDELDHNPTPQEPEQDLSATNDSENRHISIGPVTGDQIANNLDQDQSLDASQDQVAEQNESYLHQQEQLAQDDELVEYLEQPEHSIADEESPDRQNKDQDVQDGLAITGPEAEASAGVEESEVQHEHSVVVKDDDKTIHPVTVVYLEDEMSLFPPMLGDSSSMYFLSDSTLAAEPLERMLSECRAILGTTLDHHDELVLDVPSLGLHICEDSKYAAQITLAEILDVYLHLCRNDEGKQAKPLYCYLSSRVSLASQYAYLTSAGGEGKTYAEIATDHLDTPEPDDEDAERADETENQHEDSGLPQPELGADVEQTDHNGQMTDQNLEDPTQSSVSAESGPRHVASQASDAGGEPALDADPNETVAESEAPEQVDTHKEDYVQDFEQEQSYDQYQAPEPTSGETGHVPDVVNVANEDAEDGSNSSHTLQGDVAEADLKTSSAEIPDAEAAGLYEYDEQGEDLFHSEEGTLELQPEYEPYGEDELYNAEDEHLELLEQDESDLPAADQGTTARPTNEQDLSQDFLQLPDSGEVTGKVKPESSPGADALVSGNLSPPLTPKHDKQSKRKAEDDDEFLFLDLDTPDAKRQRST
ncbi:hypothetical protein H2200_000404 [Cladophialophora chaetospira]|uniref:Uncharacterized protein n=1 Tax=Cladophialophora chaetospira TaxID=386627 RepID=A0AA38XNC9_9EURO|nr:hypothetical protein H2200_000404 [Cladophialophora chaetospira]